MADEQEWRATTPRRPRDPVTVVLGVVAGLGGCALLWALALTAIFAVDPDRPSNPVDNTRSSHATPRHPATTPPAELGRESPPPPTAQQHRETP
ncbi:hypothetical protein SAMN05421837_11877 [Amycolatopsis pretoriensis]|uniref:Uncharacterized protein n=1 Tax=Amycolatopsis pretoriensis TaxID=218821 RepID=A0A1H5RIG0_9PSEU|nr:hypothetical protein [Amycolatopsis pretoriensis]SEF38126.1 hypothetical protein SAMN05421837_11877 [Amycolatopsis pretoriensis]